MKTSPSIDHDSSYDFAVWRTKYGVMPVAHTHPDVEINFLLAGSMRYFVAGRFHEIGTGEVAVFWAGMPHQSLRKSPDLDGIWITLPLLWLMRWKHASDLTAALLRGVLVRYPATGSQRELFTQWLRDFRKGGIALRDILAGEIEAHLSRLSLSLGRQERADRPAFPSKRMEQITRYLAAHYLEEITVDRVASAVGLHPKYLLSVFRRNCHMTLWEYVIRLRLAHAQRLLLTTEQTVTDIAFEAGFASLSAFYHAFHKYVPSVSPSQFRAR